ncbi:type IV toxin-antitoxin system AbiEi family antitoxin [Geothermobacter ehrlichii]|uniref:type IV toxin-antitoxin system AbiEi family antitoxin n=1 Tax=Geothermobacter ehrlichii TaxID=213224 RepID=UPI001FE47840
MEHLGEPYYAGLLSAAEYHGAAHICMDCLQKSAISAIFCKQSIQVATCFPKLFHSWRQREGLASASMS